MVWFGSSFKKFKRFCFDTLEPDRCRLLWGLKFTFYIKICYTRLLNQILLQIYYYRPSLLSPIYTIASIRVNSEMWARTSGGNQGELSTWTSEGVFSITCWYNALPSTTFKFGLHTMSIRSTPSTHSYRSHNVHSQLEQSFVEIFNIEIH